MMTQFGSVDQFALFDCFAHYWMCQLQELRQQMSKNVLKSASLAWDELLPAASKACGWGAGGRLQQQSRLAMSCDWSPAKVILLLLMSVSALSAG